MMVTSVPVRTPTTRCSVVSAPAAPAAPPLSPDRSYVS